MKKTFQIACILLFASLGFMSIGAVWSKPYDNAATVQKSKKAVKTSVRKAKLRAVRTKYKKSVTKSVTLPPVAQQMTPQAEITVQQAVPPLTPPHLAAPVRQRNPYLPEGTSVPATLAMAVAPVRMAEINPYLAYRSPSRLDAAPTTSLSNVQANPYVAGTSQAQNTVAPEQANSLALPAYRPELAKVQPWQSQVRATPLEYPAATAHVSNPYLSPNVVTASPPQTSVAPADISSSWSAPASATRPDANAAGNSLASPLDPMESLNVLFNSLKLEIPILSPNDRAILPVIKTVYPTGGKPLKVLTFKCPTELVGITPPPTKALRGLIDLAMEAANKTDLLPFDMQQVCQ